MSRFIMSKTPWERCVYPALKAALERTDYNQTTLGRAAGISVTLISRYIKGDIEPTIQKLLALEDLTGLTFREMFGECEGRR
jgi:transcriptional regulator with XRE-family HTH domain